MFSFEQGERFVIQTEFPISFSEKYRDSLSTSTVNETFVGKKIGRALIPSPRNFNIIFDDGSRFLGKVIEIYGPPI